MRRVFTMLSALAIALVACSSPPPAVSPKSEDTQDTQEDTPSPNRSFATTAQVLDAVKAAQQLQTLPGTVAASLQKSDDGGGASGCFDRRDGQKPALLQAHQPATDINYGECAYGDRNGKKLMVIVRGFASMDVFNTTCAHCCKERLEAQSIQLQRVRTSGSTLFVPGYEFAQYRV